MEKKPLKEIFEIADYLDKILKEKGYSDCKVEIDNGKISFTTTKKERYSYKSLIDVYFDKIDEKVCFENFLLRHFRETDSRNVIDWVSDVCDFLIRNHIEIKRGNDFEKSLEDFINKYWRKSRESLK